jgi:hypothetical protein
MQPGLISPPDFRSSPISLVNRNRKGARRRPVVRAYMRALTPAPPSPACRSPARSVRGPQSRNAATKNAPPKRGEDGCLPLGEEDAFSASHPVEGSMHRKKRKAGFRRPKERNCIYAAGPHVDRALIANAAHARGERPKRVATDKFVMRSAGRRVVNAGWRGHTPIPATGPHRSCATCSRWHPPPEGAPLAGEEGRSAALLPAPRGGLVYPRVYPRPILPLSILG